MAKYLFDHLGIIRRKIKASNTVIFFLDYDGTLAEFKPRPELAVPTENVISILKELKKAKNIEPVIISGRKLKDITSMVSIRGIAYAGTHGQEVLFSEGIRYKWGGAMKGAQVVSKIAKHLKRDSIISGERGIIIENKTTAIAVHYRKLGRERGATVKERFINIVKSMDKAGIMELVPGSSVIEARPIGWDKGRAVGLILKYMGREGGNRLVIYIGDDFTDEDAFTYLRTKDNTLTVWVKNDEKRATKAQYYLKTPKEVKAFLRAVI